MDVSLENLGNGGVIEKFDHELQNVIANILDPNTPQDAKREISVKVTIKPGKADRGMCSMEIVVASNAKIVSLPVSGNDLANMSFNGPDGAQNCR